MIEDAWGIETPGLDGERAMALVHLLRQEHGLDYASAVDPNKFMTMHMPANVVRVLRRALRCALDALPEADEDVVVLTNIDENLSYWLSRSTG